MASGTCSGFHHARCLLPPVTLFIGLTPLMDAGGVSALAPSRAPTVPLAALVALDCFPPCWLLLQTNSPRTCLAAPQFLPSEGKSPEEPQTSVHSALAVLIGSFLNLSVTWEQETPIGICLHQAWPLGRWSDRGWDEVSGGNRYWPVPKGQMSTSPVPVLLPGHLCQSI